uniref:Uncharacterized protein n=1 Tax=Molossus molossus TaxID=27622 RepID=A0A7J8F9A0_MOLMO|nr:hypothetical protein HJG59_008608 [Molossus molossus]
MLESWSPEFTAKFCPLPTSWTSSRPRELRPPPWMALEDTGNLDAGTSWQERPGQKSKRRPPSPNRKRFQRPARANRFDAAQSGSYAVMNVAVSVLTWRNVEKTSEVKNRVSQPSEAERSVFPGGGLCG